jgi:predicted component of type VI protein secretion system
LLSQEDSFNPRYEGAEEERKVEGEPSPTPNDITKEQKIYSLARFNFIFQEMCDGLDAEGRRMRVLQVSKLALQEESSCASCRAFYRQLIQTCATPVRIKGKPTEPPATVTPEPAADDAAKQGVVEGAATPAVTPTPLPQPGRYPRTDVVHAASRLSHVLYEMEPGAGSTFKAVKGFEVRLMALKDLTPGERDYYGVLSTYLLSAWQGREDSALEPKRLKREEIADLFQ